MRYKTILSVTGIHQSDDDLRTAADLAASTGAHLSALIAGLSPPPPIGDHAATLPSGWIDQRNEEIASLNAREKEAKTLLSQNGLSFETGTLYTETAWADDEIGERACYADLVVAGPGLDLDPELRARTIDGSLFKSSRPILIVPAGATPTLSPKVIVLAWNSRPEAAKAAREAAGLMAGAEVHVTIVDPDASAGRNGEEPGADIAAYLARHGAIVTVDRLPSGGKPVEEVLQQHAKDLSADLMVMGAYGHSRLREWVFGGVTRSVLASPGLPVLMVH